MRLRKNKNSWCESQTLPQPLFAKEGNKTSFVDEITTNKIATQATNTPATAIFTTIS